ncbi:MAG: dihydroorotate dehydrogenase [Pseudomonadota bacterium]|nr:dihydroorotate dehydrogenase [Pseudomonadota bacterium]
MVDLSVTVGGVSMKNPIMPASGSIAEGMADIVDLGRLGAIVLKTITPDIRQGVKPPRVVEYTDATLFSIGIPSKGPDYLLNHTVPFFEKFGPPVIASISADTAEDFGKLAGYITDPRIAAIEANISCPNLRAHGRAFGMDPVAAAEVIAEMKANTKLPVWAKLTPNVGDIAEVARAVEGAGADAVITANAILGMAINAETMTPRLGNVVGGLTGPAVKPVILRMVNQCAEAVKIPVIGCGGIATGEDVVEYMLAGASAVQVGTTNFVHTAAMEQSIDWVTDYCTRKGIARVSDLTGALMLPGDQPSEQRGAVAL